jgi:hypothetical protein
MPKRNFHPHLPKRNGRLLWILKLGKGESILSVALFTNEDSF